jgi:NADP-dependent 3-hydroxy acid dehydrogenase YdfG
LRAIAKRFHISKRSRQKGGVETELGSDITDKAAKSFLKELRKITLTPDAIARVVLYAAS